MNHSHLGGHINTPGVGKPDCKSDSNTVAHPEKQCGILAGFADLDTEVRLVLTPQERVAIARRAGSGIIRAISAQAVMAIFAVMVSWLMAGNAAALSALVGAAAYFVPNALFALRLLLGIFGPVKSSPLTFFFGEAFKLGMAVAVLAVVALTGKDWLVWPALLFGLLCVLKGYVLLLAFRKLP